MRLPATLLALALLLASLLGSIAGPAAPALAGPVDWHEVPASAEGRQWWDGGSLRTSRSGMVSVLSRFQPAADAAGKQPASDLYVMEIDCGQSLFRDTSINGLPQFRAEWQPAAADSLITSVISAVCAASAGDAA